MDCGFLAMLWRIWMLIVSFLRRVTVRPNVLLPMTVTAKGAVRKGEIGGGDADTSAWEDQKAEFLRNPSLRKSKQHRRRFFDFGSSSPTASQASQANGNGNENGSGSGYYGKWRKKQPKTNAFVFVTPPTVTIQDWSDTPLSGAPTTTAAQDVKPPPPPSRPPRPPSGPVPAVIVTPCTPAMPPEGGFGGGPSPFPRSAAVDHHRSGSGRHLSPDWFMRSTSNVHGHGRKVSVQIDDGGGIPNPDNSSRPSASGQLKLSDTDIPFRSAPVVFPSSHVSTSTSPSSLSPLSSTATSTSTSHPQYHQDITLPWSDTDTDPDSHNGGDDNHQHTTSNPSSPPEGLNSRAASYITSTPAKNAKGMSAGVTSSSPSPGAVTEEEQGASFLSFVSEAGGSPPHPHPHSQSQRHSNPQARRGRLPEDQLDLLPYPEVFDLDMYFCHSQGPGRARDSDFTLPFSSPQRLSLCVLRNATLEDMQQMQELQSRQSESLSSSVKDLTALYDFSFSHEYSSPRKSLGGVGSDVDIDKENRVPSLPAPPRTESARAQGKVKRFGYISEDLDEDQGARPTATHGLDYMSSIGTVTTRRVGGGGGSVLQEAEREAYRPHPQAIASRPILRQIGNSMPATRTTTTTRTPATTNHKRSISSVDTTKRVAGATGGIQEAHRDVYRPQEAQADPGRPVLRQIGNTMGTTTTMKASSSSTYSGPTSTPSSTSRVLVPPNPSFRSQPPPSSDSGTSTSLSRPPNLQIRIPGLSGRVINRTRETDLSPIKEAFHPPSSPVLPPPPPASSSPSASAVSASANPATMISATPAPEREVQCPRRRPPTLPIVIVSHHRFGSVSDYGDGDGYGNDSEVYEGDGDARCHDSESSSEDEDEGRSHGRATTRRSPGHGRERRKETQRHGRSRWAQSGHQAYGDEESGLEIISLN